MKYSVKLFTAGIAGIICFTVKTAAQKNNDYPIQPVAFTHVHVTDNFWAPRLKINAEVSIPYVMEQCRKTGRIDNFLRAAGKLPGDKLTDFTFDDTDLYKVIEGASYSLQTNPDAELEKYLDTLIAIIAGAQEPDGYLYTFRTVKTLHPHEWIGNRRWEKEEDLSHELYNAGHLFEAATAHYLATGKRNFLDVAVKNADLLVNTFGWGKEEKFPGHQIVETGLVKMYRVTGKTAYLQLAKFFLDLRGKEGHMNQEYSQAHIPVIDQHEAVGHAVRATYMYSGMADIAALTGNEQYLHAIDDIWKDVTGKKMYITGGIGATGNGEAFGKAYELPNMSAYAETCAAIANVYWNNRMFLLHGDAKYIDVLERTLYNGLLSGVSLSGDHFFYPNPLASLGQHQRSAWFSCACCISNITRFMPSVPGYIYAQNKNDLYVNLFVGSSSQIDMPGGKVSVVQNTGYPWNGKNEIIVSPEKKMAFNLRIRIPGWIRNEPVPGELYKENKVAENPIVFLLNGKPVQHKIEKGYALISRYWNKGDKIVFELKMEVKKIYAKEEVQADKKRFALQRGPVVYCLEGADNKDSTVMNIVVDKNAVVEYTDRPGMLGGVTILQMKGFAEERQVNCDSLIRSEQNITAIPYYSWANRGPGEMEVWIAYDAAVATPKPVPTIASRSKVSASVNNPRMYKALNDQYDPQDSKDASASYLHWWPRKNTTEWVQYDFEHSAAVSEVKVYWFDDGPWGGCRVPASWVLYYKKDGAWLPVKNTTSYGTEKDRYNILQFEPITTAALKLEVRLPENYAAGIHEWMVK